MVESNNHDFVGLAALAGESGRLPPAMWPEIDRRRRVSRDTTERLIAGAVWLMPSDRSLVLAVYRDGVRVSVAAAVAGVDARCVRRRLRRLCSLLLTDQFWFVVRSRDAWPVLRRRVATACVLQGRSKREAARHLQVSVHVVQREMAVVEALVAADGARARERAA